MMIITILVTTNNLGSEQLVVQVTVMMLMMTIIKTIMVMMIKIMMMILAMMINLKPEQLVDLLTNVVQVAVDPSQDVQLGKIRAY